MVALLSDFATDVLQLMIAACTEVGVRVDILALGVPGLLEAVHIELPDEGGVVVVLEIAWEDFF